MIWIDLLATRRSQFIAKFGLGEAQSIFRIIREDVLQEESIPMHKPLEEEDLEYLNGIFDAVLEGKPVQYVIGLALFDEMKLTVSPAVLIPRPETEELLYWAKNELLSAQPSGTYLDIGTGSGCLALGIKKHFPEAKVHAIDKSSEALAIAEENGGAYGLKVEWRQVDFLNEKIWNQFPKYEGIVSNPPYIPYKELELMGTDVVRHEPSLALMVPDEDPLLFYKAIANFARKHLVEAGWILVEINEYYGAETLAVFKEAGFEKVELRKDMSGKDRMIYGEWGSEE